MLAAIEAAIPVHSVGRAAVGERSIQVGLAVEAKAMLDRLVFDRLEDHVSRSASQAVPASEVAALLTRPSNGPVAAVVWSGRQTRVGAPLVATHIRPTVKLGLISGQPRRLAGVCVGRDQRLADVDRLTGADSLAYPDFLTDFDRLHLPPGRRQKVGGFAEAVTAVLSGATTFGVVPEVPDAIEPLRRAGLVHYARLGASSIDTTAVSLTIVARDGVPEDVIAPIRGELERAAGDLALGLPLDRDAEYRGFVVTPDEYTGHFYAYFIETLRYSEPTWQPQEITLERADASAGAVPERTGTGALPVATGRIRRPDGQEFAVRVEPVGSYSFTLKSHGTVSGVGPVTFLAYFLYRRTLGGGLVWQGFWLGRDGRNHPSVNAMVLSREPLRPNDLQTLADTAGVRFVPSAAWSWQSKHLSAA